MADFANPADRRQAVLDHVQSITRLVRGSGTICQPCSIQAINVALARMDDPDAYNELQDFRTPNYSLPDDLAVNLGRIFVALNDSTATELLNSTTWLQEFLPEVAAQEHDWHKDILRVNVIWNWLKSHNLLAAADGESYYCDLLCCPWEAGEMISRIFTIAPTPNEGGEFSYCPYRIKLGPQQWFDFVRQVIHPDHPRLGHMAASPYPNILEAFLKKRVTDG